MPASSSRGVLGALEQRDVAEVVLQAGMRAAVREHQVLHRELDVHQAALAVLRVDALVALRMRVAHLLAHRRDLLAQRLGVALGLDHGAPRGLEALAERRRRRRRSARA